MRYVVAIRTGRVLDTGVELAIGRWRPRRTGSASRPEDHGPDIRGLHHMSVGCLED